MTHIRLILSLSLLMVLIGCTNSSGGSDSDASNGSADDTLDNSSSEFAGSSDSTGNITLSVKIDGGTTGAQLLVSPITGRSKLVSLIDPNGRELINDLNPNLTAATEAQASPNVLQLPLPLNSLLAGEYLVTYQTLEDRGNDIQADTEVTARLITKDSGGTKAQVNIIVVGAAGDSDDLKDAISNAIVIAGSILDRAGIIIDVTIYELDGPDTLPDPRLGSSYYQSVSEAVRSNAINIVIGSDVSGLKSPDLEYAIPGSIPAIAIPSTRSASALSILELTGGDGRFDFDGEGSTQEHPDETRLAGEEIAQLIGHGLGLSDIVKFRGEDVISADPLSDTPSCLTETDCQQDGDVRGNFMFPYPLEEIDDNSDFYARTEVTPQQSEEMKKALVVG